LDFNAIESRLNSLAASINAIINKLAPQLQLTDFVDYLTLNEKVSSRSGKIGEYEREFFACISAYV
jgi:hypothetical protein